MQQIPLADGSVDVVICNHIMEHVADDRRAMRELHRVLKPGGWGIVLSPVDRDYEQTYEDDSITDPDERTRIFGQYDHRRIYGADYADRLRQAVSRSRTSTTPRPSPRPSAGYTPCRPITCMWFTKSDRRPSKRLSDGNRPTAIRGLVLPWKSLPQVMEAPLERASEVK